MRRSLLIAVIAIPLWFVAVGVGFWRVWAYTYTPGPSATSQSHWPAGTSIALDPHRSTLVVMLSPNCACSRAALSELSRLVTQAPNLAVRLVVVAEGDDVDHVQESDLWQTAQSIPGATISVDREGVEAARFGAKVSGQTFLYDPAGVLHFSGGITAARGHEGDNDGESVIVTYAKTGRAPLSTTPVFGCFLVSAQQ